MGNAVGRALGLYQTFETQRGPITQLIINYKKSLAITLAKPDQISMWNLKSNSNKPTHSERINNVTCIIWKHPYLLISIASSNILMISFKDTIHRFELVVNVIDKLNPRSIFDAGEMILASSHDKVFYLWPLNSRYSRNRSNMTAFSKKVGLIFPEKKFSIDEGPVGEIACTKTRNNIPAIVFAASPKGKIFSYNVKDGEIHQVFIGHTDKVSKMTVSEDQNMLFTASFDGTVILWNIPKKQLVQRFIGNQHSITTFVLADDLLFTGNIRGDIFCFDSISGMQLNIVFKKHKGEVTAMLCEAGKLYTASSDKKIYSFDQLSGKLLNEIKGHKEQINDMKYHNGALFTISDDKTMRKWQQEDDRKYFASMNVPPPKEIRNRIPGLVSV